MDRRKRKKKSQKQKNNKQTQRTSHAQSTPHKFMEYIERRVAKMANTSTIVIEQLHTVRCLNDIYISFGLLIN